MSVAPGGRDPAGSRVAVITVVHGRHDHLRRQHDSLDAGGRRPDRWVVVAMADPRVRSVAGTCSRARPHATTVVDLAADPGLLPLAAARNRGAEQALDEGADVLIFLDVDCLAGPELVAGYARAVLGDPETIWSGPVTYLPAGLDEHRLRNPWLLDDPHPARPAPPPGTLLRESDPDLFWSLSFALSAAAWQRAGGFHEGYAGYGAEDTDFAQQASLKGVDLGWTGDARAYHQHHPVGDPPVEHVGDIVCNAALFHRRWGRWPMTGWLRDFEQRGLVRQVEGTWVLTRGAHAAVDAAGAAEAVSAPRRRARF